MEAKLDWRLAVTLLIALAAFIYIQTTKAFDPEPLNDHVRARTGKVYTPNFGGAVEETVA